MVWNSTQSALYRAVDTHNTCVSESENDGKKAAGKTSENRHDFEQRHNCRNVGQKPCESQAEFERKNADRRARSAFRESRSGRPQASFRKDIRDRTCGSCPRVGCPNHPVDPVSRLLSDKDMLLIAGLIFVLMRENADKGLILALLFVLLTAE